VIQGYGTFSKSLSEYRVGSLSQDDVRLEEAGTPKSSPEAIWYKHGKPVGDDVTVGRM